VRAMGLEPPTLPMEEPVNLCPILHQIHPFRIESDIGPEAGRQLRTTAQFSIGDKCSVFTRCRQLSLRAGQSAAVDRGRQVWLCVAAQNSIAVTSIWPQNQ
jgi:hypothetical protein